MRVEFFVPGKLRNPLNGAHGHWRASASYRRQWRDKTAILANQTPYDGIAARGAWEEYQAAMKAPKRVEFLAHVGARWDDDNLRAGLKPVRDALIGRLIHSDAHDCGHEFHYEQRIDRKNRGVRVTVETL